MHLVVLFTTYECVNKGVKVVAWLMQHFVASVDRNNMKIAEPLRRINAPTSRLKILRMLQRFSPPTCFESFN
jgi:hypothetical protein